MGSSCSPLRNPKPSAVSTSGSVLTRVDRVDAGSTSRGVVPADIATDDTPTVRRVAVSCACMRESVSALSSMAELPSATSATPSSTGTEGRSETDSGKAVTTDAASHGAGGPSTRASVT